jgi:hypothetical protein
MKGANTNERSCRIWKSAHIYFGSLYFAGHFSTDHHSDRYLRCLTDRVLSGQPVSSGWPFFGRFYPVFIFYV